MNDDKEKWFEMQFSVIRWHLDAAIAAPAEEARRHFQQARDAHARTCGSLPHAGLSKEVQERLEHACSELKTRLDTKSRT